MFYGVKRNVTTSGGSMLQIPTPDQITAIENLILDEHGKPIYRTDNAHLFGDNFA
jgi:hypothetical protein